MTNVSENKNTRKRKRSSIQDISEDLNVESSSEGFDLDPGLKIFGKNNKRKRFHKMWVMVKGKAEEAKDQISPQLDPKLKIINEFGKYQFKEAISKKERREIEKQLGKKLKKRLKISKNPCWINPS